MSYGIHTFGLTKEQIYLIGVYFLYQVADILSFQTAYGKGFVFFVHRIEYHVAYSFLNSYTWFRKIRISPGTFRSIAITFVGVFKLVDTFFFKASVH